MQLVIWKDLNKRADTEDLLQPLFKIKNYISPIMKDATDP